jgi:hypothetical protein
MYENGTMKPVEIVLRRKVSRRDRRDEFDQWLLYACEKVQIIYANKKEPQPGMNK